MKTFGILLALSASMAFAGTGVVGQQTVAGIDCESPVTPRIPQRIVQGIRDLAEVRFPSQPKRQLETIERGVCAYLALQRIPNNPGKRAAAVDHPFDFPAQLYLAQRPLQN